LRFADAIAVKLVPPTTWTRYELAQAVDERLLAGRAAEQLQEAEDRHHPPQKAEAVSLRLPSQAASPAQLRLDGRVHGQGEPGEELATAGAGDAGAWCLCLAMKSIGVMTRWGSERERRCNLSVAALVHVLVVVPALTAVAGASQHDVVPDVIEDDWIEDIET